MISIERFAQNSPRFCFYLIYHSCKPPKKQRNDSGRMKHFIKKRNWETLVTKPLHFLLPTRKNWPKAYPVRMPSRSASSFKSCTVSCAELPRCFPLVEVSKTKDRRHSYIIRHILYLMWQVWEILQHVSGSHSFSPAQNKPISSQFMSYIRSIESLKSNLSHIMHHCIFLQLLWQLLLQYMHQSCLCFARLPLLSEQPRHICSSGH